MIVAAEPPIDESLLADVLREPLAEARTLPAEAYLSPSVLEWERRHFFEGSWVCVGRAGSLANPGDQKAIRIGNEGILLVRAEDGVLCGFYNVCRHRGHELLAPGECASKKGIRCPYHSWVYGLDGTLVAATRFSDLPGFDTSKYPLVPVRTCEWHGWAFVNASGEAPDLADHVGNLSEILEPWEPARLAVGAQHEYVVRANWKTIVENYLECYHCPSIHPALCRVSPPESARGLEHTGVWLGGPMELEDFAETMSLSGESKGTTMRGLSEQQAREVYYVALFPNLLISPHPDYVMTHRLDPISPVETYVECTWLFQPEARDRSDFDPSYASDFWEVTNREDFSATESVCKGLQSRGYRPGPFDLRESYVCAFQGVVARGYATGQITLPVNIDIAA